MIDAVPTRQPPPEAASPLLLVDGVSIAFGGIVALDNVTLGVPAGALISVIGPNGAGKTTLFNCITGLYRPDRGRITFAGHSLVGRKPDAVARLGIARTFQNVELFLRMTALENLLLGRHLHFRSGFAAAALGLPPWRREEVAHRRRAEEILDFLDLQEARHRRVGDLPLGRQRLVELGRALATDPKLLLLDEPSSGMTAEEKADLVFRIKDIREEMGITVILVEHDLKLVMGISDWIAVLDHGVKIAQGTAAEIQANPEVARAYLGEAPA
ncbi:MAG: ABC transporter ATP-binding protein [Armatimonadota bacterium]|nr:ABC transporter ATP-binding protein [Armatimonadota bacterium]MDR7450821.1 ABC transporter ATP-binding protein [Armatimonadota bacterium]MDR7465742.1 ABC transporter ATP-binding protein [Armatimonadota bacterium]MDR7493650.1 ABC transporter ATP-binding protein [Armatimonadota bacterium]MDR7499101.1 ABC transporter ATP-binding protein [Armatimonadota bacterium]